LAMVHERTVPCDCPVGVVLLKMKWFSDISYRVGRSAQDLQHLISYPWFVLMATRFLWSYPYPRHHQARRALWVL
jgi:hypothetical protein